jgi:uncharacterized membrane protein YdfJ with MMPL/SSD domain
VALAVPYFDMKNGQSGAASLPANSQPGIAFRILDQEFNSGVLSPTEIVVAGNPDDPAVAAGIETLQRRLEAEGIFTGLTVTVSESGSFTRLTTAIRGDSQSDAAFDAVTRLRDDPCRRRSGSARPM